ncbi:MAG TPA: hypothetical protein VFZ49_04505 [Pyrinomonadaceae bacterium]
MEIITKRHWLGWNSDDEDEVAWAEKSADEKLVQEKLRPRLKERNYLWSDDSD